jgi:RNA polymerase sigma factor (sigma-70 family)
MKEPAPDAATGDRWLRWYRTAPGEQDAEAQVLGEIRAFLVAVARSKSAGKTCGAFDDSDIAQDCWLKLRLLPPGQEFRGSTGLEFIAWLRTIAQREYLDAVRHGKAQKRGGGQRIGRLPGEDDGEVAIAADTSSPSKAVIREEEKRQFEEAVGQLSEKYQHVVRLRCCAEKLTWAQIAERMNETEDTVKQWFHRAREQLSKMRRGQR